MSALNQVIDNIILYNKTGDEVYNRVFVVSAFSGVTNVLLENKNKTLPLKKSATVALVGPLADAQVDMMGVWSGQAVTAQTVTLRTGMANALQGKPPTPFNVPTGMTTAWINPSTGVKAFEGEAAIAEAFKPGTGPNLMTSVIGLDIQAFDAIQREQMMQQNYGSGFVTTPGGSRFTTTQPSGNGTFLDPSLGPAQSLL